jgi:hypothetical protein
MLWYLPIVVITSSSFIRIVEKRQAREAWRFSRHVYSVGTGSAVISILSTALTGIRSERPIRIEGMSPRCIRS